MWILQCVQLRLVTVMLSDVYFTWCYALLSADNIEGGWGEWICWCVTEGMHDTLTHFRPVVIFCTKSYCKTCHKKKPPRCTCQWLISVCIFPVNVLVCIDSFWGYFARLFLFCLPGWLSDLWTGAGWRLPPKNSH